MHVHRFLEPLDELDEGLLVAVLHFELARRRSSRPRRPGAEERTLNVTTSLRSQDRRSLLQTVTSYDSVCVVGPDRTVFECKRCEPAFSCAQFVFASIRRRYTHHHDGCVCLGSGHCACQQYGDESQRANAGPEASFTSRNRLSGRGLQQ